MIDTFKKTLLAGLGAAVITKEKVQDSLEDYVKRGRISAAEAREMAGKVAEEGRREFDKASAALGGKARDLLASFDSKCIERIEHLEARVSALEGKPSRGAKPRAKA
jgi:polyhydroxyalkanoate synthesis regulator phasin